MPKAAAICVIGFLSGGLGTLLIRRMTDAERMRAVLNSIIASVFEFRLFADQPSVLLRAQWRLIAANARLLRLLAVPSLILVLPYWGLLSIAEGAFGVHPLKTGESTVVTVQCHNAVGAFSNMEIQGSPGIAVETPALRIARDAQISWRVRPLKSARGQIRLTVDGRSFVKNISSEPGLQILSEERGGTIWSFAAHPLERPILDPAVESIRVVYPVDFSWLIWFSLASLVGASLPIFL